MKHYIITNRATKKKANGEEIVKNGRIAAADEIRLATIDSKTKEIDVFEDMEVDIYGEVDYIDSANNKKGSYKLFNELLKLLNDKEEEIILFIPGFGNGTRHIKKFTEDLHKVFIGNRQKRKLLIYFWTTNGIKILPREYWKDAFDSQVAGKALARFFIKWQQFLLETNNVSNVRGKLHFIIQSMGNQVLKHTLNTISRLSDSSGVPFINECILVGADIEKNIFEEEFKDLAMSADRVHVYGNKIDRALKFSRMLHKVPRLGQGYSKNEIAPDIDNVFAADITEAVKNEYTGLADEITQHWYFFESEAVVNDINKVFEGKNSDYLK